MPFKALDQIKLYLTRLLKSPFTSRQFVLLSHPFAKICRVLDKRNRKIQLFNIGNCIDYWTVSQIFYEQDYRLNELRRSSEIFDFAARCQQMSLNALIVDAGSNIGASSRYLSKCFAGAQIWAIEPSIRNIHFAKLNKNHSIDIIHAALSNQDGVCELVGDMSLPNSFQLSTIYEGYNQKPIELCPMISMQTLMANAVCAKLTPFILKVDIEGAEGLVFDSAGSWIDYWPVLMIELHDWMLPCKATSSSVLRAIAANQRDVIIQGSTLISLSKNLKVPAYQEN